MRGADQGEKDVAPGVVKGNPAVFACFPLGYRSSSADDREKKKKDKKKRESQLEAMVFQMMEKSIGKALDAALDDLFKDWQ